MNKQSLRECILDGLNQVENCWKTAEKDFVSAFLAGWIGASIRYETVEIPELTKE